AATLRASGQGDVASVAEPPWPQAGSGAGGGQWLSTACMHSKLHGERLETTPGGTAASPAPHRSPSGPMPGRREQEVLLQRHRAIPDHRRAIPVSASGEGERRHPRASARSGAAGSTKEMTREAEDLTPAATDAAWNETTAAGPGSQGDRPAR